MKIQELSLWEAWTDGNNISTHNCLADLFLCSLPRVMCPFIKLSQMTISGCQPCSATDKAGSTMARLLSGARSKAPCKSMTKVLTVWAAYIEELLKSRHLLLKRKAGRWWWWAWWWLQREQREKNVEVVLQWKWKKRRWWSLMRIDVLQCYFECPLVPELASFIFPLNNVGSWSTAMAL